MRYLLKFDWERSKAEIRQDNVETTKKNYILELRELYSHGKYLTDESKIFLNSKLIIKFNASVDKEDAITFKNSTDVATPTFGKEGNSKNKETLKNIKFSSFKPKCDLKNNRKKSMGNKECNLSIALYSVLAGMLLVIAYVLTPIIENIKNVKYLKNTKTIRNFAIDPTMLGWTIGIVVGILILYTYVLAHDSNLISHPRIFAFGTILSEISFALLSIFLSSKPFESDFSIITIAVSMLAVIIGISIIIYNSVDMYIKLQHQKKGY